MRVLAKKRLIKHGAQQDLLTGKRRLPGFSGDWSPRQLEELATFHKGRGLPRKALDAQGTMPCIHYGELFTYYPETIRDVVSHTNKSGDYFLSTANDVLMPTSDVTPDGLAKASCVQVSGIILGGDILVIRVNPELLSGGFLSYVVRQARQQVLQLVTGTTVFHLYAKDMKKFAFPVPELSEQLAIVRLLDNLGEEIGAILARITKARQMKQGMMQNLLTGKIRLV